MQDRPTIDEALEAIVECLSAADVSAYERRVIVNLLQCVRRDLRLGPALAGEARERLVALLGREGDLESLTAELASRIRGRTVDTGDPALIEHLVIGARDRLVVANPRYLEADIGE